MGKISASNLIFRETGAPASAAKTDTPTEALRRLAFSGNAGKPWADVLALSGGDLAQVIRTIDGERQSLEHHYAGGTIADTTLTKIKEKLAEADTLVVANSKSGVTRYGRRQNQHKLDKLVDEIETLAADARVPDGGGKLFTGSVTLVAGAMANSTSLRIPKISLESLGRGNVRGQTISLKDLVSRGLLDTSKDKNAVIDDARRAIKSATETANEIIEQVRTFQRDTLAPRLGDVATAMEGLYRSDATTTLTTAESAQKTAADLRQIMLDSATLATAVGADGWDRERTLALVS